MKYGVKVGTIILTVLVGASMIYLPWGLALMAIFAAWFWLHTPSVTADTIDNDLKATHNEILNDLDNVQMDASFEGKHPMIDLGYGGDSFRLVTEGEVAAAGKAAAEHLQKALSEIEPEDAARPSIP
jgi:hypothetical protein